MLRDIQNRTDIEKIVDEFYDRVKKDEVIGFIFNDIAKVDWEKHLPVMYNFWETTVLGTGNYTGNAMSPHFMLNEKVKLGKIHFDRWIKLFTETIDSLYEGEIAETMKQRAKNIAQLMHHKLNKPGIL